MASGTQRHSSNVLEKFKITIKMKDGTLKEREIEGYKISIPDCPEAKLFVHKSHDTKNDKWCVSELESGFKICEGASKPAAVGRARRMITAKYDMYVEAVKNAKEIKKSGKVPPEEKKSPVRPLDQTTKKAAKHGKK